MWQAKILALGLAATFLTGCAQTTEKDIMLTTDTPGSSGGNYRTAVVQQGDLIKTSQLSLEEIYSQGQSLYCPGEGYCFEGFSVSKNQRVSEGETIAVLSIKGSEADLQEARLKLERAESEYAEGISLLTAAVASSSGLYAQLAQVELEQYDYNQTLYLQELEEELLAVEASFENLNITAPYDCVIYNLPSIEQGTALKDGELIAEIKAADSLLLYTTSTAKNFLYNMDVEIEYGRKDSRATITGRVVCTDDILPAGAADGKTYFKPDELPETELTKPTAYVTTTQAQGALLVPRGAVDVEDGHYYVSVLDGTMVKKRYIIKGITGGTVGESCTVVLAGIKDGQTVVLN